MKESLIRKDKAEEEFTELSLKARTLEIDLDKYAEKLEKQVMAQESKEAQVLAAEAEFNRLNRRYHFREGVTCTLTCISLGQSSGA